MSSLFGDPAQSSPREPSQSMAHSRQSFLDACSHKLKTFADHQPARQALTSLPQALDRRIYGLLLQEVAPLIENVTNDLLSPLPSLPDASMASRVEKLAQSMRKLREFGEKFAVSVFAESIPTMVQENRMKEVLISVIPKIGGSFVDGWISGRGGDKEGGESVHSGMAACVVQYCGDFGDCKNRGDFWNFAESVAE